MTLKKITDRSELIQSFSYAIYDTRGVLVTVGRWDNDCFDDDHCCIQWGKDYSFYEILNIES